MGLSNIRFSVFFTVLFLFGHAASYAQLGKIEAEGNAAVFDPNGDGFVSLTASGFNPGAGNTVDQFEIPMFGLPIAGDGDVVGDASGPSCSNTDLSPDDAGYSAYAVLKNGNLIFRFRVANHAQNVPGYSVLIDTDGKLGPSDPDYVAGSRNPGFEIDITLIKGPSDNAHGVKVYNIDGGNNNCSDVLSYPVSVNHQRAIGDMLSCNQYAYFYDFYVPFADLGTEFGLTSDTEIRFVALTNINATCAMSGTISDVGGVDDADYANLFDALMASSDSQCPTSLGSLSEGGGGFLEGATENPTFDEPIREGDKIITGTAQPTASVIIKLYQNESAADPIDTKEAVADANGIWSIEFDDPLVGGMVLSAVAQLPGTCGSDSNSADPDNEVVLVEVVVVTNYPPILTKSVTQTTYTENATAVAIDPGMAISYPAEADYPADLKIIVDAEVAIAGNFSTGQDELLFTDQSGIAGAYDGGTGVMTLTSAVEVPLSTYETALRSIKYFNSSNNPNSATRTVRFVINDGYPGGESNPEEVNVLITAVNDPAVVSGTNPYTTTYPNGGGGITVNNSILVSDIDDASIEAAEVRIINVLDGTEEDLQFTDPNGIISATYSGGLLTLTGTATVAAYQEALQSVSYFNIASPVEPAARQISFRVFDGDAWSNLYNSSFINFENYNNPPVVKDGDGLTVTDIYVESVEDTPIDICLDIEDPDADAVEINAYDATTDNGFGTVSDHGSDPLCLVFTPLDDMEGTDQFTITVCDQPAVGTAECVVITVHLDISAVNDPPVITDKALDVNEKETTAISFDVTDAEGDANTFTSASSANATVAITGNFTFDYTPDDDFTGADVVTVRVSDPDNPLLFDEGTVTVTVLDLPEEPVIIGDNSVEGADVNVTAVKNQAVNFCFTAFDPDDGDQIVFESLVKQSSDASTVTYLPAFSGPPSGNRPFCFTFTPENSFTGVSEWLMTICDDSDPVTPKCSTVTVFVTVEEFNYPPEILINGSTDLTVEVPEKTTSSICVEVNDLEDDEHFINGAVSLDNVGTIDLGLTTSLCFDYTPPADFIGEDQVEVVVCDLNDNGTCTTKVITVIVIDVNEPPVPQENSLPITALTLAAEEDRPLEFCIDIVDPEGDNITFQSLTNASGGGTLEVTDVNSYCMVFTPAGEFSGTSIWDIEICDDGSPSLCGNLQITFDVAAVNDTPLILTEVIEVNENVTTDICIEASDVEENISQLSSVTSTDEIGSADNGSLNDLCFSYTPPQDFLGDDQLEITICDSNDATVCRTGTVIVRVLNVNEPPVPMVNGLPVDTLILAASEDTPIDFCFEAIDPEGDNVLLKTSTNVSGGGSLVKTGESNFCFTFTPGAEFSGTSSWDIEICDDATPSLCNTIQAIIEVTQVNDPPIVQNKTVQVFENVTTPICVEVTDIESNEHEFVRGLSNSSIGSVDDGVANDLCFDYTPPEGFLGQDEVEVTICDLNDNTVCSTGIITVNVMDANYPPIKLIDGVPTDTLWLTTAEDVPLEFCFDASDPDGDNVVLGSMLNLAGGGSLEGSGEDQFCFSYVPVLDYFGVATWEIQVCDDAESPLCAPLIVIIDITPVNDAPIAQTDSVKVMRSQEVAVNVLDNAWDVEGDDIWIDTSPIVGPSNGDAIIFNDGTITYRSFPTFRGIDSLVYQIQDLGEPTATNTGVAVFIVEDLPFTVYQTISPNGDGINDYWHIEGIDFYTNNFIRIFDRFNNVVFEMSGYDNASKAWVGQANKGIGNSQLADGTYYYNISLGPGQDTYSGFIVLKLN